MTEDFYDTLEKELGTALAAMYQAKLQMARLEAENARLQGNWEAAEKEVQSLKLENARLREALETLERLSGLAMMSDDPARIKARAALERKE